MKSGLSLTLIVSLMASTTPVIAQEQTEPAGPIARSIRIEARRLAAAGEVTSSSADAVQQGGQSDWSRVHNVAPGTEVIVTVRGAQPGTRYVVRADESGLTVLNVTDLTFRSEDTASRVLRNLASNHPDILADGERAGGFVENDVRVDPNGVFVAGRKVADLGQVVERLARADVVEVNKTRKTVYAWPFAVLGSVMGYFVGALAGSEIYQAAGGDSSNLGWIIWGGGGGAVAGGFLAHRVASRKGDALIYRAP